MTHLKQAVKLIQEGDRYIGHGRFFHDFIDDWAYRQTGLYPLAKPLPDKVQDIAIELTKVVRDAWEISLGEDFLGNVIEECGGSGHLSFFRTPPALSNLMAKMLGGSYGLSDFADVCCGTGSLTLAHIHQTFLDGGTSALAKVNIHCEDLSANKVKITMLQVLNLLDILGSGKPLYVHSLRLIEMNSLTRERGSVVYDFSGANNPRCKLNDSQKAIIQQAVAANIKLDIIAERMRVPVNLVYREAQRHLLAIPKQLPARVQHSPSTVVVPCQ